MEGALELLVRRALLGYVVGKADGLAQLLQEHRVVARLSAANRLDDLDPRDGAVIVPVEGLEELVRRRRATVGTGGTGGRWRRNNQWLNLRRSGAAGDGRVELIEGTRGRIGFY